MRKVLLLSVLLLLLLHKASAQPNPTFTGEVKILPGTVNSAPTEGDLKVNGNLTLTAGAVDSWVFFTPNNGNSLLISPHWDGSKETTFEESGDVRFSRRVTIGNVTSPGTLGINTLTLAVGGKIGARSVHVVAPNVAWPDYVFSRQYTLRPLLEVEQFVQANCHLPDVPSEAAVKAEGVDLGAMDALLLRKVEELTLYMIELKKENAALQARVEQLEN